MASEKETLDAIVKTMENDMLSKYLGIEYVEFEKGKLVGRMPYRKEVCNPYNTTHGGALFALCDIVAGVLACTEGKYCTTSNGSLNYLSPAVSEDYIYCTARIIKNGGHLVNVRVEVTNSNGDLLDDGSYTMFKTKFDVTE